MAAGSEDRFATAVPRRDGIANNRPPLPPSHMY
jgi:hypothetical protein